MTARTSAPVWIVDSKNIGKRNPTYPSTKIESQLMTRYYGTDVVSQGQATISLTSPQILNMFATPIPILPAPGAGYALVVNGFIFSLIFGGTAYQAGDEVALYYSSDNGKTTKASGIVPADGVNAAASTVTHVVGATASVATAKMNNFGLMLSNKSKEFTTGNGTAKVTVLYSVITL